MMHSFLLLGQSNMAGRGDVSQAPQMDLSRVKVLVNGRWQPLFRPINFDRSFAGFNLAESFAEAYLKEFNVDVGLVCCADGGTSLNEWAVGGELYQNAVNCARLASRTSTIAGVLWHQGEADCAKELCATYKLRFEPIMQSLRNDLHLHDVPFLLGGLGDFLKECPFADNLNNYYQVNEQLQQIAKNNPMTAFVSAKGLTSNQDKLHFDTAGLYQFGLRYFEQYKVIYDKNKIFQEKQNLHIATKMEVL